MSDIKSWDSIQKRYLDPVSTNDIKMDLYEVNKTISHLLMVSNGVIKGMDLLKIDDYKIRIGDGVIIIDKVFIEFKEPIIMDIRNTFYYLYSQDGIINSPGEYPIIAMYQYKRNIKNPSVCEINIMKNPSRLPQINYFCLGIIEVGQNMKIIQIKDNATSITYVRETASFPPSVIYNTLTHIDGGEINQ
jgi:hypothetical protein